MATGFIFSRLRFWGSEVVGFEPRCHKGLPFQFECPEQAPSAKSKPSMVVSKFQVWVFIAAALHTLHGRNFGLAHRIRYPSYLSRVSLLLVKIISTQNKARQCPCPEPLNTHAINKQTPKAQNAQPTRRCRTKKGAKQTKQQQSNQEAQAPSYRSSLLMKKATISVKDPLKEPSTNPSRTLQELSQKKLNLKHLVP